MKSYKKLNRLINKYADGYDVEYSLDEIRQMVDEAYDNDALAGSVQMYYFRWAKPI